MRFHLHHRKCRGPKVYRLARNVLDCFHFEARLLSVGSIFLQRSDLGVPMAIERNCVFVTFEKTVENKDASAGPEECRESIEPWPAGE